MGENINGPSVIKAPSWVKKRLGKYYMYFAHHRGKHIRLAYADNLAGPWFIYEPGVLHVKQVPALRGHVASPDVHVDEKKQTVSMYFHGPLRNGEGQRTLMATSRDGLSFAAGNNILGRSYFRVFTWGGSYYSIDGVGHLNRSEVAGRDWQRRQEKLIPHFTVDDDYGRRTNVRIRHSAVLLREATLYLFFTRKGDAPERIVMATVQLTKDWTQWKATEPVEVLKPDESYEGTEYEIRPSMMGYGIKVQQLRYPCIFEDEGRVYLFYSFAGEMGIAMAEIKIEKQPDDEHRAKATDQSAPWERVARRSPPVSPQTPLNLPRSQ